MDTASAPATSPWWSARSVSRRLPDFPWDHLTALAERARATRYCAIAQPLVVLAADMGRTNTSTARPS